MTSDKYTKDFEDFNSYDYPGQIMPHFFQHTETGGDGQPGLQRMIHGAIAAYGPYHVIEGCAVTISTDQITGGTGYVMWSGSIISVDVDGMDTLTEGQWFAIDSTGGYYKTGTKPTGVIVGRRIYGTNYDLRANRYDENSKVYFPNQANFYGKTTHYSGMVVSGDIYSTGAFYINGNVTGNNNYISGYKEIDGKTGVFTNLSGHSDIKTFSTIDFQDTYHIKDASQITGTYITADTGTFQTADVSGIFRMIHQGSSFPASPGQGEIFWNSTDDALYRYSGAAWVEIGGT